MSNIYEIITDGACRGNPGPGGWAAIIIHDDQVRELGGAEANTTNNRMELRAAVEGLRQTPPDAMVRLTTDSTYLLNGATEWLQLWRKRDWRTIDDRPVEHRDLWEELATLDGGRVEWQLVRGHSGDRWNERANAIAQGFAGSRANGAPRSNVRYLSLVAGELQSHATWEECRARVHGVSGARYKKCSSIAEELATITGWGLTPAMLEALDNHESP